MLPHGGRLREAAARCGIPIADWLDLSTGINPHGWPVQPPPATVWQRLPEQNDGLEQAAREYYGAEYLLPVAGSQAAIQALPWLRAACRVGVLTPGYSEHAQAWLRAGHIVIPVAVDDISTHIDHLDVMVVVNPNNPTGSSFPAEQLREWHRNLAVRGGWMVLDEAFIDLSPEHSLAPCSARYGLVVLRSLGKFFGLAGARVGFVCAEPGLLSRLEILLGPWAVSGPARWIARAALRDNGWQAAMRNRLAEQGALLRALLVRHGIAPDGGCSLFQWHYSSRAGRLHEQMAASGILIRRFDHPAGVRFGLPATEAEWQRLDAALGKLKS